MDPPAPTVNNTAFTLQMYYLHTHRGSVSGDDLHLAAAVRYADVDYDSEDKGSQPPRCGNPLTDKKALSLIDNLLQPQASPLTTAQIITQGFHACCPCYTAACCGRFLQIKHST